MTQIKINYLYEIILLLLKNNMHQRELAKELNTSLTRIQSNLKELRDMNAIDYEQKGKNHIYFIKKNLISKSLILNAENYKLIKLLRKYPFIEQIIKEVLQNCNESMIIIFGSYAKGNEKKESDLDIFINSENSKVKNTIELINDLLSIKIGKFNQDDLLIQEIIKNHIIIKGGEEFYEKIKFFN